jgi:hypothetical protein
MKKIIYKIIEIYARHLKTKAVERQDWSKAYDYRDMEYKYRDKNNS